MVSKLFHIIFFISAFTVSGQISIQWKGIDNDILNVTPDSIFNSWPDYNKSMFKVQSAAFEQGYLSFSVDSLRAIDTSNYVGYVKVGEQWIWKNVALSTSGPEPPEYLTKRWKNKVITPKQFFQTINETLLYFANNGYPFARAQLDSLKLKNDQLKAILIIDPGKLIKWDTLTIEGNAKIKKYYLENYLGIHANKVYNEENFNAIVSKLKELPFVKMIKKPEIKFVEDKAQVTLFLKHKSANFINGIIGVLPNSNSTLTGDKSQLVITGDLKLNLGNSFGYGEKIKVNWKRIQTASQQLTTSEEIPFILKSPLGITHSLDLLKQDSTFINFKNKIGIKYDISSRKYFTVFWENDFTNSLTETAISKSNLTATSGGTNAYGLNFSWNALDYPFNPRKGFYLNLEAKAGIKNFSGTAIDDKVSVPLNNSNDISTTLLVPKTSMIYEVNWDIGTYVPIWKVTALKISNQSGGIANNYLLDNDLYRLGGFSTLRGFDQQSVFSSAYSITTVEFRFLFEENSNLHVFMDQSVIQQSTISNYTVNYPTAIGAGINFQAKPGVFSLSYALGKFDGTPFDFSAAKIHFGFVNLF